MLSISERLSPFAPALDAALSSERHLAMLCSSTASSTMQFDRSSPSYEAGPSSRAYGSARDPSPKDSLPTRPRHHSRSFSNDPRFAPSPSSWASISGPAFSPTADALPKRSPNSSRKNSVSSTSSPPNGRVESVSSSSEERTSPPTSSSSATSPSSSPTDLKAPAADSAPSTASTSASTSPGQSPSRGARIEPGTGALEGGGSESEGTRVNLARLRNAQAKRRPKMMRLTPAFSSLPSAPTTSALKASGVQTDTTDAPTPKAAPIAFPTKEASSQAPDSPAIMAAPGLPRKALPAKQPAPDSPGVGLQIDLKCIPSPSLADATGTVSTSRLPELVTLRDRHGRPIKPSLKSPHASAFIHHRTESTPELPTALRTKSVPTTPTVAKAVKFDANLEHVKIFKFKQRPAAVSRDASPEQTETETEEEKDTFPFFPYARRSGSSSGAFSSPSKAGVAGSGAGGNDEFQLVLRLPNFPSSTRLSVDREVFLERIFLADDLRSVKGTVQVRNISFEKWVAVRFTLDNWTTVNEVSAEHSESIKGGSADRFTFSIKLNELLTWPRGSSPALDETKTMLMCLRYTTGGTEYWDNNENQNYQLDFRRRQAPPTPACTPATGVDSQQPRAAVAPSAATSSAKARVLEMGRRGVSRAGFAMEDLRRELDRLRASDDEDREDAGFPPVLLRTPIAVAAAAAAGGKAGARASPPVSPGQRSNSPSMWSARYDFGESLRNPSKGKRNTTVDRAAALDYFSSRPSNLARASEMGFSLSSPTKLSSVQPSLQSETPQQQQRASAGLTPKAASTDTNFIFNVSSPGGRISEASTPNIADSPDFRHRFGMISPGLGEAVEHQPIPSPNTPSPMVATRALEAVDVTSPLSHERFYSYPPSRNSGSGSGTHSPAGHGVTPLRTHFSASQSFEDDMTIRSPSPSQRSPTRASLMGLDGLDFTPESSNASPTSPLGPFHHGFSSSESNSVTSTSSLDTASTLVTPEDDASISRMVPMFDPSASPRSLSPVSTGSSTPEAVGGDGQDGPRFRPASMTDYDELVSRYCWNSELVPSSGSMIHNGPHQQTEFEGGIRPRHRSPLPSGATTPTLGF